MYGKKLLKYFLTARGAYPEIARYNAYQGNSHAILSGHMLIARLIVKIFSVHEVQEYTLGIFCRYTAPVVFNRDTAAVGRQRYRNAVHFFFGSNFTVRQIFPVFINAVHAGFIQAFHFCRNVLNLPVFYFVFFTASVEIKKMLFKVAQAVLSQPHAGTQPDMFNIGKFYKPAFSVFINAHGS